MKRLPRILFSTMSIVSLLLCVAMAVLWIWSYRTTHFIGWSDQRKIVGALSMGGLIRLEHWTHVTKAGFSHNRYKTPRGGLWNEVAARDRKGGILKKLGFASARVDYYFDGKEVRQAIYLPHWSLVGLFGLLPAVRLMPLLRRRPRAPGLCAACGYDMRATPERCPECGAVPLRQVEQHQL